MCGIAGIFALGERPIDSVDWRSMAKELVARGPDQNGFFTSQKIGLVHQRLAVIDVAGGQQPMLSHCKRYVMVFNGEIYNYLELKKELSGHILWRTNSDAEVLLEWFVKYGVNGLATLRGMFALAIYDLLEQTLYLARDARGEKPLYYFRNKIFFAFASLAHLFSKILLVTPQINYKAFASYLRQDYILAPNTIYQDVFQLPPGYYLKISATQFNSDTFVRPDIHSYALVNPLEELQQKLCDSLREQIRSDVSLGLFLSGGVDSSLLASLLVKEKIVSQLQTFSVGFHETSFDESVVAKEVSDLLGTCHQTFMFSEDDLLQVLETALHSCDQPFADPSYLPSYLLSQQAKKHVTVALTGDGADELFMGYPTFFVEKHRRFFYGATSVLHMCIHQGVKVLSSSHQYMGGRFKWQQYLKGKHKSSLSNRHLAWLSSDDALQVLHPEFKKQINYSSPFLAENEKSGLNSHTEICKFYLDTYLTGDILFKSDRASMAHGLELRSPFLDKRLVAWALSLAPRYKLCGRQSKWLLRQLLAKYLPSKITQRKKHGFAVPVSRWFCQKWRGELLERIQPYKHVFNYPRLEQMLTQHQAGQHDYRKELYTVLAFCVWNQKYNVKF